MKIEVYSDGSGNTLNSDGGWGYRLVIDGVATYEGSGYLTSATNNVAEITAAIEGLKELQRLRTNSLLNASKVEIVLVADSQLVLGYASGKYRCKALHLAPLYIELRKLYQELNATTRWVKGHNGEEHNEACDALAKSARTNKNSTGASYVGSKCSSRNGSP